jgi:predicted enzyme related to lactoylglutathione lyase
MKLDQFALNITSQDPERLNVFYRDVVGLEKNTEMGEHAYAMGGATLFIDGHAHTKGPAQEPHRYLLDFFVGDIEAEQARLESAGVRFIRDKGREDWGGVISTFEDPDGNYVQLIEFKPE